MSNWRGWQGEGGGGGRRKYNLQNFIPLSVLTRYLP